MQLGNNIYNLRKEKGLSQEKLAEKVNVTRQTISNWELGETSPNPEQLLLLSKALNKSIDELVGNEIEPAQNKESTDNVKNFKNIKVSLAIICGSLAGVLSFVANRFRYDEILMIAAVGALVGVCLGFVIQNILKSIKN